MIETTNILKGFVGYELEDSILVPTVVCRSYSTAERLCKKGSVIKEIQVPAIDGVWHGPVVFIEPSNEDLDKDKLYARYTQVLAKVEAAGISHAELAVLHSGPMSLDRFLRTEEIELPPIITWLIIFIIFLLLGVACANLPTI